MVECRHADVNTSTFSCRITYDFGYWLLMPNVFYWLENGLAGANVGGAARVIRYRAAALAPSTRRSRYRHNAAHVAILCLLTAPLFYVIRRSLHLDYSTASMPLVACRHSASTVVAGEKITSAEAAVTDESPHMSSAAILMVSAADFYYWPSRLLSISMRRGSMARNCHQR